MQKNNKKKGFKYLPLITIPKGKVFPIIKEINKLIKKIVICTIISIYEPDIVWVAHPETFPCLPQKMKAKLIYESMDDYSAIEIDISNMANLCENERMLLERADLRIISSNDLKLKLAHRYKLSQGSFRLIRNGFDGRRIDTCPTKLECVDKYKIGYVGTISHWFDFNVIQKSLEDFPNIEYHLIGPVEIGVNKVSHSRIKFYSTIEHDRLFNYIKYFDCLVMPFVINDITKSVDPVKLYEYINYYKNIICIEYEEIKRFNKFVYFYSNYNEFKNTLSSLLLRGNNVKYSQEERIEFLKDNTWGKRGEQIVELINSL